MGVQDVLSHWRIGRRLALIVTISLLGMVVLFATSLYALRVNLMEDRRVETRHLVEAAHTILAHYYDQGQSGAMSEDAAKAAAKEALRHFRYGDSGYIWIHDMDGVMVMHPLSPELEGEPSLDMTDAHGNRMVANMNEVVRSQGAGFADYYWEKPGTGEAHLKVSYVKGFEPWGWVVGTGIYVDDVAAVFWSNAVRGGAVVALVLALVGGAALVISRGITRPLGTITGRMSALAEGDTSIDVPFTEHRDEIGELAQALQVFKDQALERERLQRSHAEKEAQEERQKLLAQLAERLETTVGRLTEKVAAQAGQLDETAHSMSSLAEESHRRAADVTSTAERSSGNAQTMASATEELTQSISEIVDRVSQSNELTRSAVNEAERANGQVRELETAAERIGQVITLIRDIAEQTNLLALNATIEAARAGEAGKGFAVVANEVKNLAGQTSKATDEISTQIAQIQDQTREAVSAIERIAKVVEDIDAAATSVASVVEQQGTATKEISRNVQEVSSATKEVTDNMAEVTQTAQETGAAAKQVVDSAAELMTEAKELREEVAKFTREVKAS